MNEAVGGIERPLWVKLRRSSTPPTAGQPPTAEMITDVPTQPVSAKIGSSRGSLDHLVGDGEQRRRHVQANRLRHDQVNDEVDLVDRSTGRSAGFAPAKSCRPNRRRAAKVDEGHGADENREFLFFVADVPDADYFTRCVLYWVITGLVQ